MHLALRIACALLVASLLAMRGLRKKSLSRSGAVAAFIVGAVSVGCAWRYGMTLLLFYYSSSLLTKFKSDIKARLEEGVTVGTEGERTATQVLSCSLLAVLCCVFNCVTAGPYGPGQADMAGPDTAAARLWLTLELAYMTHFAVCTGDTWASELGILSSRPPIIITTLQKCPPGSNGGVSALGTLASVGGGLFIGLVYACFAWLEGLNLLVYSSLGQNPASTVHSLTRQVLLLALAGSLAGFLGSLIDSLFGATMQVSYQHRKTGRVQGHGLKHQSPGRPRSGGHPTSGEEAPLLGDYALIVGRDWLTNEQVNMLSALSMMFIAGFWFPPFFKP
eukprot:g10036.t1